MKETGVIFQDWGVRAILDDLKTMTRRVMKPQPPGVYSRLEWSGLAGTWYYHALGSVSGSRGIRCPYGVPGDRLFFTMAAPSWIGQTPEQLPILGNRYLEVTGVKVERVQDISEEDAKAEGVDGGCVNCGNDSLRNPCGCASPEPLYRDSFIHLWDSINARPKPVKVDGEIHHYVSYPWEDMRPLHPRETREHQGKPWHVYGNPWVFTISFKRIKP